MAQCLLLLKAFKIPLTEQKWKWGDGRTPNFQQERRVSVFSSRASTSERRCWAEGPVNGEMAVIFSSLLCLFPNALNAHKKALTLQVQNWSVCKPFSFPDLRNQHQHWRHSKGRLRRKGQWKLHFPSEHRGSNKYWNSRDLLIWPPRPRDKHLCNVIFGALSQEIIALFASKYLYFYLLK